MAPLTRSRARQPGNVPSALNACYYAQRASAALIISEATQVSMQGQGYAWTPGIHSASRSTAGATLSMPCMKPEAGSFYSSGMSGVSLTPPCSPIICFPVAPSAITPSGSAFVDNGRGEGELVPFLQPRALQIEEMPYIVQQYIRGAGNALNVGFDGVEIHAANGYLLEQFIESGTNHRTDAYGGSIQNRARLLMEVVEAVIKVWRPDRVGVRLSPLSIFNDQSDDDRKPPSATSPKSSATTGLAYLHLVNPRPSLSRSTPSRILLHCGWQR